jgi:hypothetical protein
MVMTHAEAEDQVVSELNLVLQVPQLPGNQYHFCGSESKQRPARTIPLQ